GWSFSPALGLAEPGGGGGGAIGASSRQPKIPSTRTKKSGIRHPGRPAGLRMKMALDMLALERTTRSEAVARAKRPPLRDPLMRDCIKWQAWSYGIDLPRPRPGAAPSSLMGLSSVRRIGNIGNVGVV